MTDNGTTQSRQGDPLDDNCRRVINDFQRGKRPVYLTGKGIDITFETRILHVDTDRVELLNSVGYEHIAQLMSSDSFSLQVDMIRFDSGPLGSDGLNIHFPLEGNWTVEETRRAERFPFSEDEKVTCEILNPFDRETKLAKQVIDMSASGLSIRTPFESKLFQPGSKFENMRIMIGRDQYTKGTGEVVYSRKLMDMKGQLRHQIGIKLDK